MNFVEAVNSGLTQPFVWSGRASRSEYWWFALFACLVVVLIKCLYALVLLLNVAILDTIFLVIFGILPYSYLSLCGLSLQIKRLHDTNHSGWWYFLSFIPIVGPFYLLYLTIKQGDESSNKYGDNPLNRE